MHQTANCLYKLYIKYIINKHLLVATCVAVLPYTRHLKATWDKLRLFMQNSRLIIACVHLSDKLELSKARVRSGHNV